MNQSSHSIENRNRRPGEATERSRKRVTGWRAPLLALLAPVAALSSACGGSSPSTPTPVAAPTPAPAAAITAKGNGALVVHPSINRVFAIALETPIKVTETGGGTADWNFARMSLFLRGREVERSEVGADTIRAAGSGRINPRTETTGTLIFRLNSEDFDDIRITLGFGDVNTGRQFTVDIDGSTFTDVNLSLTPLLRSSDPR